MFKKYLIFLLSFINSGILAQQSGVNPLQADDQTSQLTWVEKMYDSMSVEQRIGQLIALEASSLSYPYNRFIASLNKDSVLLGSIFFKKYEATKDSIFIKKLDEAMKIPVLTASQTLPDFPGNKILAALNDDKLIEKTGLSMARYANNVKLHINFIPKTPISYLAGSNRINENYTLKDIQRAKVYVNTFKSNGILSGVEDEFGFKVKPVSVEDSLQENPFSLMPYEFAIFDFYSELINSGVSVISTSFNNQQTEPEVSYRMANEISDGILTNIIKEKLGFQGLLISRVIEEEEEGLDLFLSGNDIIRVDANHIKSLFEKLKKAYITGLISQQRLEFSVKKILMAKYKVHTGDETSFSSLSSGTEQDRIDNEVLNENIAENAVTLIKNEFGLVPVRNLDIKKIAFVPLGKGSYESFLESMRLYTRVDLVKAAMLDELLEELEQYNLIIVGMHPSVEVKDKINKFSVKEKTWLYEISRRHNVILSLFTDPEELKTLASVSNTETIFIGYENSNLLQEKTAQLIFGAINSKGILPVTINEKFQKGTGLKTNLLSRLSYGLPENVGLARTQLNKIDSIVNAAIATEVIPGAQVLVARKGRVVYRKSFGKTRYQNGDVIDNDHIYDLASLTKILATLPMVMKLVENKEMSLLSSLKEIYPPSKGTNKKDITILEMLTHFARLKPWIPFYLYTLDPDTGKPSEKFYSRSPKEGYSTKVIGNLYIRDDYKDSIRHRILKTDLRKKKEYRYSDLPYYILKEIIEQKLGNTLDNLTNQYIYRSIGANNTTFNPLEKFPRNRLVPSEDDTYFRNQVVQGYVHDMGAAMQGGVGGHAGLFSNSNDVAKIMQMYLWDGYYGGKRYFRTGTIDTFNKCYFCESDNRRGVGFDKPQLAEQGPTCGCVSMKSFGHSGFTGTYTWADPEKEIVYVFLSNRTFPSSENRKLIKEGTRTVIQQVIYDAITE